MPIPKPRPNEGRKPFLDRCISFVVDEGTGREQAVAICINQWQDESKSYNTWKAFDNKRSGYVNYATNLFTKALKQQAKPYLNLTDLNTNIQLSEAPIRMAFKQLYKRVMQNFGRDVVKQHKTEKTELNWGALIDAWLESNTTNLIVGITRTTQQGIERLLQKTLDEGLSIEDFAKMLEEDYLLSRRRGRLIGRTEVIRASNYGSLLGAQQVGGLKKIWLSARDNRVRGLEGEEFDHWSADGQDVDLDANFVVSGEQLEVPGDPNASPGNTIQCRCVPIYERI